MLSVWFDYVCLQFLSLEGSKMMLLKVWGMFTTVLLWGTPCQTQRCDVRPNFRWWQAWRFWWSNPQMKNPHWWCVIFHTLPPCGWDMLVSVRVSRWPHALRGFDHSFSTYLRHDAVWLQQSPASINTFHWSLISMIMFLWYVHDRSCRVLMGIVGIIFTRINLPNTPAHEHAW